VKISIAMATYNGEKYLQEQLDSFVQQTRLPDELVVSDDGSTDQTMQILHAFAEGAPFEVILHQNEENLGYAGNFNRALELTSGDLVFLSDQDDVWFDHKIEEVERVANQNSRYLFFIHDGELTNANGYRTGLTKIGQKKSSCATEFSIYTGCLSAVRRTLLTFGLPIPTEIKAHDIWLGKLSESVESYYVIPCTLQYIRRHESNASSGLDKRLGKNKKLNTYFYKIFYSIKAKNTSEFYLSQRILLAQKALERIENANFDSKNNDICYLEKALKYYKNEIYVFQSRLDIRNKARVSRPFSVLKFWFRGGYDKFSGVNSAIRDLVLR